MRWHSNRWTVAEWTEWWDSLSPSDQSYFGKLQMAFPEYFKATDVSEQSYQEELQRHRQEHSQEQAEALSDFHARQREDRSRSPLAAASAKAAPKAVSSSIPAAQRLQMGGSSSSSSGLRTSAGGTVRVGPPLTAAPAQIRSEKLQSGWAARFWEHNPGIFLFRLPKLFF